ncbi:hypothetical protein [Candidatus Ruminimicrobiellum ovillum]|uniref:hypothetical protein n=1 Tax=Candidatus Ruminimicrobiellum ovillum TaxID=1947927 RepID=UPI00355947F0
MKKVFSLLAVLAVTVFMASSVWAANISFTTQKAYASFAAEELSVNFDLYLHVDGQAYTFGDEGLYKVTASSITFDLSHIELGTTTVQFAKGQVFARISHNLTKQKAGTNIYMFTKNTEAAADGYKANYTNVDNKYGGLIRKGNGDTYAAGDNAPIEMLFKKVSDASTTYPTSMSDDANTYGEKFLTDKAAGDFNNKNYAVIGTTGVNGGIWIGYAGTEQAPETHYSLDSDVIVFFGAKFDNVFAGDQYGTECIMLQTTTE